MKKKICWITADSFIDVDLPIIDKLPSRFKVDWIIVLSKTLRINYNELIERTDKALTPRVLKLSYRARDLRVIMQYYQLSRMIRSTKADIVYIDCPGIPYFLPLLRLFVNRYNTVIAIHNVKTPKGANNPWLSKFYISVVMRLYLNIHVFSQNQYEYLNQHWNRKTVLLAPLALKDFGKPNDKRTKEVITFLNFGIIRDYKRIDVLIEAAQLVYDELKIVFKVLIVGDCNNWGRYERLIKYPFLFQTHIRSIPNSEVADFFAQSHYFVLPYQDIAQSGALTVAFNYNLPIIASDLPSFREVITHGIDGYLFKVGSVVELAKVLKHTLLNHNNEYDKLRLAQRNYVAKNLSTSSIVERYSSFFDSLS